MNDIYKRDILTAMRWLKVVKYDVTDDTIFKCWRTKKITDQVLWYVLAISSAKAKDTLKLKKELVIWFLKLCQRLIGYVLKILYI